MVLGGLVKGPVSGVQAKLVVVWWSLLVILKHVKI